MGVARDTKYGTVETEHGSFKPGEPVVVFRGHDKFLLTILDYYKSVCHSKTPNYHLHMIDQAIEAVTQWQIDNPELVVTPTSMGHWDRIKGKAR